MLAKIIIWGKCQESIRKGFITYHQGEEKYYQQVAGRLIEYCQVEAQSALEGALENAGPIILCTNQIQCYTFLEDLLSKQKGHTLVLIPHLERICLEDLLNLLVSATGHVLELRPIKSKVTILLGQGETVGQVMMEMLGYFHLLERGDAYHFLLKSACQRNLAYLAEVEDVLRDYIAEKSTLSLKILDAYQKGEDEQTLSYLLCSEIKG